MQTVCNSRDGVRGQARRLLATIRHARSLPQLEAAFSRLMRFILVNGIEASDTISRARITTRDDQTLLCVYSILTGAFTRKASQFAASSALAGGFNLASERLSGGGAGTVSALTRSSTGSGSILHLLECMNQLQTALITCGRTHLPSVTSSTANTTAHCTTALGARGERVLRGGLLDEGSLLDAMRTLPTETMNILAYALGEMADFALQQRLQSRQRLHALLSRPFWDVQAIVDAVLELSAITRDLPDVLQLQRQQHSLGCSADDLLETTQAVTPLRDPVSKSVVNLPARGLHCTHLAIFDVASFVRAVQQRNTTLTSGIRMGLECPICDTYVALVDVRVDCRALEAMRAYTDGTVAKTGDDDLAPRVADLVHRRLTVDHVLQWDLAAQTVTVALRNKGGPEQHDALILAEDESGHDSNKIKEQTHAEESIKRRRVEIAGHVLYVDDV